MTHQVNSPKLNWNAIKGEYLRRPANELQYVAKGFDQKTAEDVAQKTYEYLKDNGSNAASTIANELGEVYLNTSNPGKVQSGSILAKAAAGTHDLSGKSVHWWTRLWSVVKGYLSDFTNWFAFGTSDLEKLGNMGKLEKIEALVTKGGVHALELMAIIYVLYLTRQYTFPRLQLAWKNLKAGNSLAKCQFKNTENEKFEVFFDMKKHKWVLAKVNGFFGSLFTSADKLFVNEQEAKEFFSTEFFARFLNQCKKYIEPYLSIDKDSEIAKSNIVKYVSQNKNKIQQYMFKGQYAMFESKKK